MVSQALGLDGLQLTHVTNEGGTRGGPYFLRRGVSFVGRDDDNEVVLPSELVSRRHAKLIVTPAGVTVHDLDSHNGVFLNGKKVRSNPVQLGDRLYFADCCLRVDPLSGPDVENLSLDESNLERRPMSGEADPGDSQATQNLAALIKATDLLTEPDLGAALSIALTLCRDLTDSSLAQLVTVAKDGTLSTAGELRATDEAEQQVNWPVIRKTIDESVVLFSKDSSVDPVIPGDILSAGDGGALMCVPIISRTKLRGAIYLARPFAGSGFSDREVETVSAVAHILGTRMDQPTGSDATQVRVRTPADTEEGRPASEDLSALDAERQQLKARVDELSKKLVRAQDADNELSTLKADVQNLNRLLQDRSNALADKAKALQDAESEIAQQRTELAALKSTHNEHQRVHDELATTRATVARLEDEGRKSSASAERIAQEADALRKERAELGEEIDRLKAQAAHVQEAMVSKADLKAVLDDNLPARTADRLLSQAVGQATAPAIAREEHVCVFASLSGFDAWSDGADDPTVVGQLNSFVSVVATLAERFSGRVTARFGCGHLLLFAPDDNGLKSALSFANQLANKIPRTAQTGVQAGVHIGRMGVGTFGEGDRLSDMAFGEGMAVSRGAADYAEAGTVLVTQAVQAAFGADGATLFILKGPHLIRGFQNPVNIFQLSPQAFL